MSTVTAPVSFSKVRTEFGTGSTLLSAYRRGGGIVPVHGNTTPISATAAGLTLSQFSGTSTTAPVGPHTVNVSPSTVTGFVSDTVAPASSLSATTNAAVATPLGGVGPFTYSWTYVSGDVFNVTSAASSSTTFSKTGVCTPLGNPFAGAYRCTITDTGNGNYTAYADVTVRTTHYYDPA